MASCVRLLMCSCSNTRPKKLLHSFIKRFVWQSFSKSQFHTTLSYKLSTLLIKRLAWKKYNWQKVPVACQCSENRLMNINPICLYGTTKDEGKQDVPENAGGESRRDILKILYNAKKGENRKQEFDESPKDDYFRKVWKRNVDDKKSYFQETQTDRRARHKHHSGGEEDASASSALTQNTFGLLNDLNATPSDFRDHNERLKEVFKDDDEEENWRKNISLSKYGRKNRSAVHYNKMIDMFAKQGKVNMAIQVFDRWMLVEDRVQPNKYTFITLMSFLAKLGYTRKMFQLYRQMKNLGLDPPGKVYSLLFNSCENCPMPEYGLNRANNLYHHMKDMGIELRLPTVKSAMRAFAKCGDFSKAFQILDETTYPLDIHLFNALLIACISDKRAGFKKALQVWMLMAEHRMKPSSYTYNLLAHCMRDSGIGEPSEFIPDLVSTSGRFDAIQGTDNFLDLGRIQGHQSQYLPAQTDKGMPKNESFSTKADMTNIREVFQKIHVLLAEDIAHAKCSEIKSVPNDEPHTVAESCSLKPEDTMSKTVKVMQNSIKDEHHDPMQLINSMNNFREQPGRIPNDDDDGENASSLLLSVNKYQHPVKMSDLVTPEGRLALLGGVESFLFHMKDAGADPDIKTFTMLLACLPSNGKNEANIIRLMESHGVTPEIDFLNDVLMKRNLRNESHTHKEILQLISKFRLTPNMRTYAALAMACNTEHAGFSLLEDMRAGNLEPTGVIISHLMYASRFNFKYKLHLLQRMEELNLKPDERMIQALESSIVKAKQKIVKAEQKGNLDWILSPSFQKSFGDFLNFYRPWLKRTEILKHRHPWDGLEDSKNDNDIGETS